LVGLPFFYGRAVSFASNSLHRGFWIALRSEEVARTAGVTPFSLLDNLNVFSIIIALIAFYEMDGTRKRRWIAILAVSMAIGYGVMTGAKSSISIIPILLIIRWIRVGRPSTPTLVVTVSLCVILFLLGCIFVNLYYVSDTLSPTELVVEAAMLPANYLLGSLVAFDKVLTGEYVIQNTQRMARGFLEVARKLGADIDIPPIHAQYVTISDYENTNTYTIYFSYIPDIGLAGTAIWMTILGVILVIIYRSAVRQNPIAIIMYGMLAYALIMSIQAERFLLLINQYGKTLAVLFFLYRCPQLRIRPLRVSMSSSHRNP
jgi:oligosaccharide repeat unit polymerase